MASLRQQLLNGLVVGVEAFDGKPSEVSKVYVLGKVVMVPQGVVKLEVFHPLTSSPQTLWTRT